MSLTWNEPEDNGGSDVTGYVLERREASRKGWNNKQETTELEITFTKLIEGKQYYFRVAAVNEVGQGPFAETEEPVTAKCPFGD